MINKVLQHYLLEFSGVDCPQTFLSTARMARVNGWALAVLLLCIPRAFAGMHANPLGWDLLLLLLILCHMIDVIRARNSSSALETALLSHLATNKHKKMSLLYAFLRRSVLCVQLWQPLVC